MALGFLPLPLLYVGGGVAETLSPAAAQTAALTAVAASAETLAGVATPAATAVMGAAGAEALSPTAAAVGNLVLFPVGTETLSADAWPQSSTGGVARMAGAVWPDYLPSPTIAGYRLAPAANVVRTTMDFGAARVRRKGTRPLCRLDVQWVTASWTAMLFDAIYRWRAEEGGTWFDIELAFPVGIRWASARFVGDLQQTPLGPNAWRITATLDVLQRPVLGEAELAAILDDEGTDPAWPTDQSILPRPTYDGYQLTDHPVLARSGDDLRGLPQQRRRSFNRVTDVSCRWVLTGDQAATWDAFFKWRALEGARWFSMPVFSGIGLENADARFIGGATWQPLGGDSWSVEAPMEVRERPVLTEADLDTVTSDDAAPPYADPQPQVDALETEDFDAAAAAAGALEDLVQRDDLWGGA